MANSFVFKALNPYYLLQILEKSLLENAWLIAKLVDNSIFNIYMIKTHKSIEKTIYIKSSSQGIQIFLSDKNTVITPKTTFDSFIRLLHFLSDNMNLQPKNLIIPSKNNAYIDNNLIISYEFLNDVEKFFLKEIINQFDKINQSSQEIIVNLCASQNFESKTLLNGTEKLSPKVCNINYKPKSHTNPLFFRQKVFSQENISDNQILLNKCTNMIKENTNDKRPQTWYAQMSTRKEGGISIHYLSNTEENGKSITQIDHKRIEILNEKKFCNSEQFFLICELNGFARKHFLFPTVDFAIDIRSRDIDENFFAHIHEQKNSMVYDILDAKFIHEMLKQLDYENLLTTGIKNNYWLISTNSKNTDQLLIISSVDIMPINPSIDDENAKFTEIITLVREKELNYKNMLIPELAEASIIPKFFFLTSKKRKELELERCIVIEESTVQLHNKILVLTGHIKQLKKEVKFLQGMLEDPISNEIIKDAVVLICSGKIYDLQTIKNLFASRVGRPVFCPLTNIPIRDQSDRTIEGNTCVSTETNNYLEHFNDLEKELAKNISARATLLSRLKGRDRNNSQISTNLAHVKNSFFLNSLQATQNNGDLASIALKS